jgi:hypothetical protein
MSNDTIAEKIDLTREQILKYINEQAILNDILQKDYVPNAVINNLVQSVKDTEVGQGTLGLGNYELTPISSCS